MSNKLTETLPPNDDDRTTQPSITAVFELIQNVKQVVDNIAARQNDLELQIQNVKLEIQNLKQVVDNIAARQNDLELQIQNVKLEIQTLKQVVDNIAARQNDMESQIKSGLSMLGRKIDILARARLTTEADYSGLLERVEELESKAP